MLILKNISKQYHDSKNYTLKNINLKFANKGLVSILGPSGCGKSTLLNIISSIDTPSAGKLLIDNININKLSPRTLNYYHGKFIGLVYQNYNLLNYMNVVDNIELINKSKHTKSILDYLHLSDKKFCSVKNLSGGEKQRVSIARALVNNPRILLCDEPTGALDSKTSEEIMKLLKDISKKILVIVVTHNENLAKQYSDRIITMNDGKIIADTKNRQMASSFNFNPSPVRISQNRLINIIVKNIQGKFRRNILFVLAFSIGLISLAMVLGLSVGFNKSLVLEEKNSLSKYPIYISETSENLDNSLNNIFTEEEKLQDDYIYSKESAHKNHLTEEYIEDLQNISSSTEYQIKTYFLDNKIINIANKSIDEFNIIYGKRATEENEIILVVNNHKIDANILNSIGLTEEKYQYSEILNAKFKINKNEYTIVGIAEPDSASIFNDLSGLFLNTNKKILEIPLAIMLYPKDYENKQIIINTLNKYPDITYTDYASTFKNVTKTIVDAISIILIGFSVVALLVSTIMIGIIAYISVVERIKEIGLLKSLGLSTLYIKLIFIGENLALGLIAAILSITFVKIISIPINSFLSELTGMKNILLTNLDLTLIVITISLTLSFIGSYFPIRQTKKIKISECLKYE